MAAEMLHHARHREPAIGAVFAVFGQRENGPVHDILLRNLSRERHTGKRKGRRAAMTAFDDLTENESHRPAFTSWATRDGCGGRRCSWAGKQHRRMSLSRRSTGNSPHH